MILLPPREEARPCRRGKDHGEAPCQVRRGGVDQDEARDIRRMAAGVQAQVLPTEGMADEDVGRRDARPGEGGVQLRDDPPARARERADLAPAQARPVVDADPREGGHQGGHGPPARRAIARARIEDHGRGAPPERLEVEAMAPGVEQHRALLCRSKALASHAPGVAR